ncbi:glycosyltransferase family 2 protein [Oryzifoliimicrobium ureilyticus]|uniref:glycosyltransferase family 2 protein n=1 Tax=Oryzifoliimicrobium ureilyticus TaxID=3113724 RepID=UPI0030766DCF
MNEPVLSICVPTFNRQFLLERNIRFHLEAFRNLGVPFEIVVVDDCSTDATQDYLRSLGNIPELRAFRRDKNSGFLSNYAFAMQRAAGRYAIFLGDDDLLIPHKVVDYLRILEDQPELGMIQAPWMLVDGRAGGSDMGPYYRIPAPARHAKGDFRSLLDFIFKFHVFPEFMIIRRDVLAKSISAATPFIFWAFLYTTRALDKGDILFMPEPFARVTAISDDPRQQQGNKECMFEWDSYRGGIEYLASHAYQDSQRPLEERSELVNDINRFMMIRQQVAFRLHMNTGNWVEAYIMYHRMSAYQHQGLSPEHYDQICKLAGITTAAREAIAYGPGSVFLDPIITDETLSLLPESLRARLTRQQPDHHDERPRAFLRFSPDYPADPKRTDGIFDIMNYIEQFV